MRGGTSSQHEAWAGAVLRTALKGPAGGNFEGFSEFAIVGSQSVSDGRSGDFVFLELEPRRFVLQEAGRAPVEVSFDAASPAAAEEPAPKSLDVLGVTLGMPIDDAIKAIRSAYTGATMTELKPANAFASGLYPTQCESAEFVLEREIDGKTTALRAQLSAEGRPSELRAHVERMKAEMHAKHAPKLRGCREGSTVVRAFHYRIEHTDGLKEEVTLFRPGAVHGAPSVVAIGRVVDDGEEGRSFRQGLKEKWGPPGIEESNNLIWATNPQSGQQLRISPKVFLGRCLRENGRPFRDGYLEVKAFPSDCGVIGRVWANVLLLIDTSAIAAIEQKTKPDRQKSQEKAKPRIRF